MLEQHEQRARFEGHLDIIVANNCGARFSGIWIKFSEDRPFLFAGLYRRNTLFYERFALVQKGVARAFWDRDYLGA